MAAPGFADREPEAAARVLAWLDVVAPDVVCAELVAIADAPDLRPRLGALRQPVLVCCGTLDLAVTAEAAREIARAIPDARYEAIPGAAHALLLEAPARVTALVAEFVLGAAPSKESAPSV